MKPYIAGMEKELDIDKLCRVFPDGTVEKVKLVKDEKVRRSVLR